MEKSSDGPDVKRTVKKLTLPDGFRVGICDLDNILKEVADLKISDTRTIKAELLNRVKASNYVASSAENEYATALLQEYNRKWGKAEEAKTEMHQHTKG
ncbi:MAG: hypothetical protein ACLPVI_06395 [Dehalococcoidales bacterium]